MASRWSPGGVGCRATSACLPVHVLAWLIVLLCGPLSVVSTNVTDYSTLQQAVYAGGSHLVTANIFFTKQNSGSLWLNSTTNPSLTLTGSCGNQPCTLDAGKISAHFVVPPGFSLTLNNLMIINGGRGGDSVDPCLGQMAPKASGDPLSLTGDCTTQSLVLASHSLDPGEGWSESVAETLCGRLQCGTVVVGANANLVVNRCLFVNNTGSSDGTYYARGSAISIIATAGFTITDSSFVGNAMRSTSGSLSHGGGAFSIMQPFNSMKLLSDGGTFPPMLIQNTTFRNNIVYGLGGALFSQIGVGSLQVLNCTFDSNTAFSLGGAATTGLGGAVAVTFMKFNSPFQGANFSHRFIYMNHFQDVFRADLSLSDILDGEPDNEYDDVSLEQFLDDYPLGPGFPPDVEHADFSLHAHYNFSDTTFISNAALPLLATVPSPTSGGAVYFGNGGYGATFTRCNFSFNTAARGGAMYYRGQSVESVLVLDELLDVSVVPFNTHGIMYSPERTSTGIISPADPSVINHDHVDEDYLALQPTNADYNSLAPVAQVSGYMISLVDCSFARNTAAFLAPETSGRGGAVYIACGTLSASDTSFVSNAALAGTGFSAGLGSYGGAVYATNECSTPDLTSLVTTNVTLLNSVLRNNSAASEGGAVAVENFNPSAQQSASIVVLATGTTFDSNSASLSLGRGGALFGNSFARFTLKNCTVTNNQASQGGALHTSGTLTAFQSSFASNAATLQGGALYVTASASLDSVSFTTNRAVLGGAMFVGGNSSSLNACLLISNAAVNGSALALAINSTVNMSSTTSIRGNVASKFGSVFVSYPAVSLTLAALFSNNTAQAGGSVFYDATIISSVAQPGSGDDQVVANYGPNVAALPAAAPFAVNGLPVTGSSAAVTLKSGAPLALVFNLTDGFGQLVDSWQDVTLDVSCTAFASAAGAAPGGCPPGVLRGAMHAGYFDGSSLVVSKVFAHVGASVLLAANLQSPTVPMLLPPAGLSYTINVTVAQCAPLETFDEGQQLCVCAAGAFLNASLGACSTCPLGSNAPQPGAGYCNPNPPGFVSKAQTTATANVTLAGVSAANFTASTRIALTASLATVLNVQASVVNVTGVVDAPVASGRRLLAASAVATYTVTTTNSSLAASLRATLGNTTALGASLTSALQSSGDPALLQVTGAVPAPATEVSLVLAAEPCPRGTYLDGLSQACQACLSPLVTTSVGSTACEPCPPRSAWAGAAQCIACPSNSILSPSDPTRCACQAGYYDTQYGANLTAPDCAVCPLGGACDTGYVAAAAGWWREDTRSAVFYRCSVDKCVAENITGPLSVRQQPLPPAGQPSDNCVEGNTGPFCAVCKNGYAVQSGECAPCAAADAWDNWSQDSKGGLLIGCILVGLVVLAVAFLQPVWPALERAVDAALQAAADGARCAGDCVSACYCRCCCRCPPLVDSSAAVAVPVDINKAAPPLPYDAGVRSDEVAADKASGMTPIAVAPGAATGTAPVSHHHHTRRIDVNAVQHSLASNAAFAVGNAVAFVAEVDGGAEEEDTGAAGESFGVERQTDFMDRVEEVVLQFKAATKIFVNFFQIASTFLKSLDVPWPSVFGAAMSRISLVNLNLVEIPAAACLHPSPSYYSTFNGYTLGLLAALGLSAATLLLGRHVVAPLALRGVTEPERTERMARLNRVALARTLLVLYLVYPGVSVAIFAVFTCTTLDSGVSYLDADARIVCYDSVHRRYMGGAAVWLVLIPFGVPAFFLWLLRRFKVPQMAALLSDNAFLLEGIKLAWAEGLAQPVDSGELTVDSISTLHLEALFAFFMHDVSAEDAAEILAGTRPPVAVVRGAADAEDPKESSPKKRSSRISQGANVIVRRLSDTLGKLGGRASGVSKRIMLIQNASAKAKGQDEADARRTLVLTSLLTYIRTSGDFAVPPLLWGTPTADEAAALERCSPEAVSVHASGLRCADVPRLMDAAMSEVSFLFAAYRTDCWYWEVVELIRKLMLTSILALIAPGSAGQVVVGILIAFTTLVASLVTSPYAQKSLNFIAQAAQLNLFFLLFVALLLKLNVDGEQDKDFFGVIVISVCTVPVILPLAMRVYLRFFGGGLEGRALVRDAAW